MHCRDFFPHYDVYKHMSTAEIVFPIFIPVFITLVAVAEATLFPEAPFDHLLIPGRSISILDGLSLLPEGNIGVPPWAESTDLPCFAVCTDRVSKTVSAISAFYLQPSISEPQQPQRWIFSFIVSAIESLMLCFISGGNAAVCLPHCDVELLNSFLRVAQAALQFKGPRGACSTGKDRRLFPIYRCLLSRPGEVLHGLNFGAPITVVPSTRTSIVKRILWISSMQQLSQQIWRSVTVFPLSPVFVCRVFFQIPGG